MKIALVSQEYPPETAHGGIASQTYRKAHGLAGLGHEVWVISHSIDAFKHERSDEAVHVIRIPGPDGLLPVATDAARWVAYSALVASHLSRLHGTIGFDLIDFAEWGAEGFVYLLNRTEWNRVPCVVHIQGPLVMFAKALGWPDTQSVFYQTGSFMEGTCLRLADAVYSSSRCSAEWCVREYGLAQKDIPVIHAGIDLGRFTPRPVPKAGRPTVLFVGRLAPAKGVETLFEAARILRRRIPDLRVRLIGRGEPAWVDDLRLRAGAAGCADTFEFAGFVPNAELPEEYSRAHVFAGPSLYEGGPGFVYLEAMACGLPVAASSGSGASESIRDGENGILVPPGDARALAEGLETILTDQTRRSAMARAAVETARSQADSRDCLQRLQHFYETVLAAKSAVPAV